ncbi:unnamed protein product [Malus baccata var. baccata]
MSWNATHNQLFCIAWPPIIIHLKKKGHSQIMQNQPSFLHKKMGKLLVTERVNVAPPKAMEMRIKVKYTSVYHTELYFCRRFGFPSQCSKTKNYPQLLFIGFTATEGGKIHEALEYWGGIGGLEAQELRKRPRDQPVQKLLIGLIADGTTNEHYNFKLDFGM